MYLVFCLSKGSDIKILYFCLTLCIGSALYFSVFLGYVLLVSFYLCSSPFSANHKRLIESCLVEQLTPPKVYRLRQNFSSFSLCLSLCLDTVGSNSKNPPEMFLTNLVNWAYLSSNNSLILSLLY